MTYRIVRFFSCGSKRTIKSGLSLKEAQDYCQNPETCSKTCKSATGRKRTRLKGEWFDGYYKENGR